MKVIVKKTYHSYAIGQEIEVRPQDAALLLPRGVVSLPGEKEPEEVVKVEPVKKSRKK